MLTSAPATEQPADLRPPHPSGPIPVVRDLRPPHPSGQIPIVGAPPMSALPAEVTDDQLSRFLADAAELRRATGPIPIVGRPDEQPTRSSGPTPTRPPVTAPTAPAPAPAPVSPRSAADERAFRSFTRPLDVIPGPAAAPQPVQDLPGRQAEGIAPVPASTPRPAAAVPARPAVAAPSAAAPLDAGGRLELRATEHPQPASFFERVRAEAAPRPAVGPAPQRTPLLQPASMLGRRTPARPATARRLDARHAARAAALVLTGVVLLVAALVIVLAVPTPSLADRAGSRVLVPHAVAPRAHAAQGSRALSTASQAVGSATAAATSPHPSTSLLTAFATPAASRTVVTPTTRRPTASTSATARALANASASARASASASTPLTRAPRPVPAVSLPSSSGSSVSGLPSGSWNLAWSDEFAGSALSSSKWTTLNNSTFGDGNQQLECELARNVTLGGGVLSLAAQREQPKVTCGSNDSRFPGGRSYSGATIETKGKAGFTYGYFEIRAKLPMTPGASKGLWPAFWLRPVDGGAGELDVLETIGTDTSGTPDTVHQTIHPAYGSGTPQQVNTVDYPSGSLSSGYHTYGVDWEPGSISWYIDGKLTWSRTTATTSWMKQDFSRPYFIRLNLAVGGSWPGSPTSGTRFPASYDIDWIHVYQH